MIIIEWLKRESKWINNNYMKWIIQNFNLITNFEWKASVWKKMIEFFAQNLRTAKNNQKSMLIKFVLIGKIIYSYLDFLKQYDIWLITIRLNNKNHIILTTNLKKSDFIKNEWQKFIEKISIIRLFIFVDLINDWFD